MTDSRAYIHRGEPIYVEGVPFGSWIRDGDHYVSSRPLASDDDPLVDPLDLLHVGWLCKTPGVEGWRHVDEGAPDRSVLGPRGDWREVYVKLPGWASSTAPQVPDGS